MKPCTRIESGLRWSTIVGLAVIAAFWCRGIIERSAFPRKYDGYRFRNTEPATWEYPTGDVATWVSAIAAEALVACLLLHLLRRTTAAACFGLALAYGAGFFVFAIVSMHAPLPFVSHTAWLFTAGSWLLIMALVNGLAGRWARARAARAEVAPAPARVVRN